MSVQEMAEVVLKVATADADELKEWFRTEDAAFEAYVNDYFAILPPGCGKKDN